MITNETSLDILKQLKANPSMVNEIDTLEEASWLIDALDKAIKALEQQPCEDCISRISSDDIVK